jgi:hypothetical protein
MFCISTKCAKSSSASAWSTISAGEKRAAESPASIQAGTSNLIAASGM